MLGLSVPGRDDGPGPRAPRMPRPMRRSGKAGKPYQKSGFVIREEGYEDRPISRKALRRMAPELYHFKFRRTV